MSYFSSPAQVELLLLLWMGLRWRRDLLLHMKRRRLLLLVVRHHRLMILLLLLLRMLLVHNVVVAEVLEIAKMIMFSKELG